MESYVSLIKVTPQAREEFMKAGDYFAQIMEISESFGGKTEGTWWVEGPFQFLWIGTYPDKMAALKARLRIEAIGVVTVESFPRMEMAEYFEATAV